MLSRVRQRIECKRSFKGWKSFSQCGEDMILKFYFDSLKKDQITYLDIGANDPVRFSNTFYFYRYMKSVGVLIEPNPELHNSIQTKRPKDILIKKGIGKSKEEEVADYYLMDWHEFNTFSKSVAVETEKKYQGRNNIKGTIQIKLVPVNQVLDEYFSEGIDLLNIDVEGMDLEILKALDFARHRPSVICVEIKVVNNDNLDEVQSFLAEKGYRLYSHTPINGIFVSER